MHSLRCCVFRLAGTFFVSGLPSSCVRGAHVRHRRLRCRGVSEARRTQVPLDEMSFM